MMRNSGCSESTFVTVRCLIGKLLDGFGRIRLDLELPVKSNGRRKQNRARFWKTSPNGKADMRRTLSVFISFFLMVFAFGEGSGQVQSTQQGPSIGKEQLLYPEDLVKTLQSNG